MISQYFIGGMMPESANSVQQPQIEIWLYRGGWQCYKGPGVEPYCTGESAKPERGRLRQSAGEIWASFPQRKVRGPRHKGAPNKACVNFVYSARPEVAGAGAWAELGTSRG